MHPNDLLRPAETTDGQRSCAAFNVAGRPSRQAWEKLLSNTGTNGFMITLGFRTHLDRTRAVETANHFLSRINRRIFGKRFRRYDQSLRGAVVLEQKRHSTRSHNSPHFHFVVIADSVGSSLSDESRLRVIVEHEAGRLRYPTLDQLRPFGPLISGTDFVDVTRIHSPDGLANYLTKECKDFGLRDGALNIGFFGMEGIVGLQIAH